MSGERIDHQLQIATSGYAFKYKGCLVSWKSSKQQTVSLSSTEAEYIALINAVKESVWLRQLLIELKRDQDKIKIYCDNKSTICLSMNPEYHTITKLIDIRYHYIREVINNDQIEINHIATEENTADGLTKGLPNNKHYKCMQSMRLEKCGKNVDMKILNNSQSLLCALNMQVKVHQKRIYLQIRC